MLKALNRTHTKNNTPGPVIKTFSFGRGTTFEV
jgi:hypothetical protein